LSSALDALPETNIAVTLSASAPKSSIIVENVLRMGQGQKVWPLLKHTPDPRVRCALVLTGLAGVETLAREGVTQARAANLFGLETSGQPSASSDQPGDHSPRLEGAHPSAPGICVTDPSECG
jgi:hypothetical protein